LILLLFALGRRFSGNWSGYAAVFLIASAPLFANQASSGGLDLLAGTLLLLVCWLALEYWAKPDDRARLGLLVTSLLLLANTRYEGGLWILPFGILILAGWWKIRQVMLPSPVILAPLFLIIPVLQHWVEYHYEVFWQVGVFEHRTATFSLSYFSENVVSAASYFFGLSKLSTSSYVLSVVGSAGIVVFSIWLCLYRLVPGSSESLRRVAAPLAAIVVGFWCLFVLLMVFNWGYFSQYLVQRLTLPFQLIGAVAAVWAWTLLPSAMKTVTAAVSVLTAFLVLEAMSPDQLLTSGMFIVVGTAAAAGTLLLALRGRLVIGNEALLGVALLSLIFSGIPRAASHRYTEAYGAANAVWAVLEHVRSRENDSYLFVSDWPAIGALARQASVRTIDVLTAPEHLESRLESGELYRDALYAQLYRYSPARREWEHLGGADLLRWFEGELVHREFVTARGEIRFYRILGRRKDASGEHGQEGADEVSLDAEGIAAEEAP